MQEVYIPFSGFYDSIHNDIINAEIEQLFYRHKTDDCNEGLQSHVDINYRKLFPLYAADYVENFNSEFYLTLQFKELDSPREYNFETDKIVCTISDDEILKLYCEVDHTGFADFCNEKLSSRDGFMSFYDDNKNPMFWGFAVDWDINQLNLLLEYYYLQHDNYSDDWELYSMDDSSSNGVINNIVDVCMVNSERLYKIHNYLKSRAERVK